MPVKFEATASAPGAPAMFDLTQSYPPCQRGAQDSWKLSNFLKERVLTCHKLLQLRHQGWFRLCVVYSAHQVRGAGSGTDYRRDLVWVRLVSAIARRLHSRRFSRRERRVTHEEDQEGKTSTYAQASLDYAL